jgi:hypothetical protein
MALAYNEFWLNKQKQLKVREEGMQNILFGYHMLDIVKAPWRTIASLAELSGYMLNFEHLSLFS